MRKVHQVRDPRYCNFFLDANALDRKSEIQSTLVDRFHEITGRLGISPTKSFGVQNEIQHPNTPIPVRTDMGGVYTINVGLAADEISKKRRIHDLMTGNATSNKHIADADHLFEAAKYGGGYFLTHDQRILSKQDKITNALGTDLKIVTLQEFVDICENI